MLILMFLISLINLPGVTPPVKSSGATEVPKKPGAELKAPQARPTVVSHTAKGEPSRSPSPTLGLTFSGHVHLTLSGALRLALRQNTDLRLGALAIEEARIQKQVSKRKLYPIIKVEASALFWNDKLEMGISLPSDLPITISFPPMLIRKQWTVQSTVTVAQPLTPLLSLKSLYDLDKAEIKARSTKWKMDTRKIREEVEKAYYNCLKADAFLRVIAQAEKMLDSQEKWVRNLLDAKLITDSELAKIHSAKADLKAQKIKVIAATLLSRQYLAYLLGMKLDTRITLEVPPVSTSRVLSTTACEQSAFTKRPAFALISLKQEQLEYAKKALSFDRLPRILAVTQYKNSQGFGDLEPENQWFIGLTLSWEFDWMNKKRELDKLALKGREIDLTREKARRGVTLEIHKAHLEMLTARALIKARREAVKAAQITYDKLSLLLSAKYTTNAELLTARS
ncbi:TolC family protein, partial [Myxococcota bacterium]|nr:TolC family protein [Myxococcota bacterium]